MKKNMLILIICVLTIFNSINVRAAENGNDWIGEILKDHESFQELILKHPDAVRVQEETSYIFTVEKYNSSGKLIDTEEKRFSDISKLEEYKDEITMNLETNSSNNAVMPLIIEDGETRYVDYNTVKVGLALYKYSSNRFYVAFVCEGKVPELPPFGLPSEFLDSVLGLALGNGLVMDGTSYAGRITYYTPFQGEYVESTVNGRLSIRPTGTEGIGFHSKTFKGSQKTFQGVISCTALKQGTNSDYVSAYGEYAKINLSLDPTSFSVSIPAGISFNLATTKTAYPIQDALDLN